MNDRLPWEPEPEPSEPGNGFVSPYPAGHGGGYAQTALEREIARVTLAQNGTRNHTLNRAAFSLGQLVAGGELDRTLVERELTAAAELVGLQPREIIATIRSGLDGGSRHPRQAPVPNRGQVPDRPGTAAGQPDSTTVEQWVREHLPALDWHALWAEQDTEEWIIEPLLPARRLVALYSAPKVGKSLLMLELAVGIACGSQVLGYTPDRPRRLLYVDFENDPRGDIRERLVAMGYTPDDLANVVYLSYPRLSALDSERGGRELLAAVETYGCEVVVIDTVSRAVAGEENENDTWLAFYRHTGKALKAAGVALVRLDHTGKDETRGQRGGSAKSGDVDAVWRMSKITDSMFRLDCEAHRMQVVETALVIHRDETPVLRHRVDAGGRSAAWSAKVAATVQLMDELQLPLDTGGAQARQMLREAGLKASNEIIAEAVRARKTSMNSMINLSGTGDA